jgi:hypothetical protein
MIHPTIQQSSVQIGLISLTRRSSEDVRSISAFTSDMLTQPAI